MAKSLDLSTYHPTLRAILNEAFTADIRHLGQTYFRTSCMHCGRYWKPDRQLPAAFAAESQRYSTTIHICKSRR